MGFPLRPSTAQHGRPNTSRRMKSEEYVFTNPEVILRTMQDRQQQKTGFGQSCFYERKMHIRDDRCMWIH